jgi:hypothetical protein
MERGPRRAYGEPMADVTRRSLLQTGAAATVASLLGVRAAPAAAAGVPAHLTRSGYSGLVASSFRVRGGAPLRLLSVSDVAGAATQARLVGADDAFALSLSGAPGLEAGIHTLSHPSLGTFDLFLAPVAIPGDEQRYEIVVDRSVKLAEAREDAPEPAPGRGETPVLERPSAIASERERRRRRRPLLRRATLRRTPEGARAEVVLRAGADVERVRCKLVRRGRTIAVAARDVRDDRAVLRFRTGRRLRAGSYSLVVTTIDAAGARSTRRKRVTLA